MISISLNMKFWFDGQDNSTRLRNVEFCWPKLKKLTQFIKSKNINAECFLFDFSPDQYISDSIHIPYPLGDYKKAEKTNIILKNYVSNYDFFMMIDSDAFFYESDYDKLLEILQSLESGDVITFDLAKIDTTQSCVVDNIFYPEKANWSYAYAGDKERGPLNGYLGGLGGVYIVDTNLLINLGGFDEKYVGWGGEDGDMFGRIMYSDLPHQCKPQRSIAPFHLPHFCDYSNPKYSTRFINE